MCRVTGTMVVRLSSVRVIGHSKYDCTSSDACGEETGCDPDHQVVSRCSTSGGSQGMYITFASTKYANKAEPTLALIPRFISCPRILLAPALADPGGRAWRAPPPFAWHPSF